MLCLSCLVDDCCVLSMALLQRASRASYMQRPGAETNMVQQSPTIVVASSIILSDQLLVREESIKAAQQD